MFFLGVAVGMEKIFGLVLVLVSSFSRPRRPNQQREREQQQSQTLGLKVVYPRFKYVHRMRVSRGMIIVIRKASSVRMRMRRYLLSSNKGRQFGRAASFFRVQVFQFECLEVE